MRRVLYRPAALSDFAAILDFIGRDNPTRAISFTDELRQQCSKLALLPGTLGRARPELRVDMRSFAFKGYVIFFRYHTDVLEIVNVLEGHRDIDGFFRGKD